jgi:Glycosyl hydrolase family 1
MGWNVVPDGLKNMLIWISKRYNNPLVCITENGSAEADSSGDVKRVGYFQGHIRACAEALLTEQVNLAGYFAWSLMDNFEWQFGYQRRFGLCRVDFDTLTRTPRDAALWYRDTIRSNGRNVLANHARRQRDLSRAKLVSRNRRLPERVLIGYGQGCDAVRNAIHDGVNIVIWAFLDVTLEDRMTSNDRHLGYGFGALDGIDFRRAVVATNLNLTSIRAFIEELNRSGYGHVLHFASVGGWNGAHLNNQVTAIEWYQTFAASVGDIFDGIDWDLEGNDQIDSDANFFTMDCLNKMGAISRLAKAGALSSRRSSVISSVVFTFARMLFRWKVCKHGTASVLLGH